MQWMAPSSLASITFLLLLSAVDLVVAQISAPSCTDTSSWQWSYNSLDQSPCTVTAYLFATCYNGVANIVPLNGSPSYSGPTKEQAAQADSCWCNTVIYNLLSACSECQGAGSLYWSNYYSNCTTILAPANFPHPVPVGTRIPQWILLDIPSTGLWSSTTAKLVGDSPEILPGELLDKPATPPTSSIPSPTAVSNGPTVTSTTSTSSKPQVGAVVGGAVGGVVALLAIGTVAFMLRRRRRQSLRSSCVIPEATVTPLNPTGSTPTGTARSERESHTAELQQPLHSTPYSSASPSSPRLHALPDPAGLYDKELAQQQRSARSRHSFELSPNSESAPSTLPPVTTDRSSATLLSRTEDQRPWQSEVETLRREMEQLRAERFDAEAPPSYFSEV